MKLRLVMLLCTVLLLYSLTSCKKNKEVINQEPQKTDTVTSTKDREPQGTITKTPGEVDYIVENETYHKGQIMVSYPQISGLENEELEDEVNRVLEDFSLRDIKQYSESDTYELNYEVATQTNEILSIVMKGYLNVVGAAHPSSFVGSVNVDLANGRIVRLAEMEDIEEIALRIMDLNGLVIREIGGAVIEGDFKEAVEDYLSVYTKERLVDELSGFDFDAKTNSWAEGYSYYRDGKLHIYLGVPHVIGDYIDIEGK